jgi:hypothetical protein
MTFHVGIGARRIAREILSLWKDLAIHFSSHRAKSQGCRQIEARRGLRRAAVGLRARGGAASRIARQILSLWQYLEIHFSSDRGKSGVCRQIEARG